MRHKTDDTSSFTTAELKSHQSTLPNPAKQAKQGYSPAKQSRKARFLTSKTNQPQGPDRVDLWSEQCRDSWNRANPHHLSTWIRVVPRIGEVGGGDQGAEAVVNPRRSSLGILMLTDHLESIRSNWLGHGVRIRDEENMHLAWVVDLVG
jgi:hypothetical protein